MTHTPELKIYGPEEVRQNDRMSDSSRRVDSVRTSTSSKVDYALGSWDRGVDALAGYIASGIKKVAMSAFSELLSKKKHTDSSNSTSL